MRSTATGKLSTISLDICHIYSFRRRRHKSARSFVSSTISARNKNATTKWLGRIFVLFLHAIILHLLFRQRNTLLRDISQIKREKKETRHEHIRVKKRDTHLQRSASCSSVVSTISSSRSLLANTDIIPWSRRCLSFITEPKLSLCLINHQHLFLSLSHPRTAYPFCSLSRSARSIHTETLTNTLSSHRLHWTPPLFFSQSFLRW